MTHVLNAISGDGWSIHVGSLHNPKDVPPPGYQRVYIKDDSGYLMRGPLRGIYVRVPEEKEVQNHVHAE